MSGLKANKQGKAPQTAPSKSGQPGTPLDTPTQALSINAITSDHVQQFLDILKGARGTSSSGSEASPSEKNEDGTKPIRASKPKIPSVYQFWNKSTYKYDTKESFDSSGEDDKYVEYIGVFRRKYDSKQVLEGSYLDIKSTTMRDTLQKVLEGVTCISLREDKPSINPDILFTYLHQLEAYRKNTKLDSTEILHLDKLIEFLATHYASTSEKLTALLEHKEITFELLPVFFRPNSVVYMVSADSEKPRCLMFDSGLVKATMNGKKHFELSCRYLTHDGKCFGEATTTTMIAEFHGVMKITSLGVYPLEHHAEKQRITEQLTKRGRKFISLIGTHYRKYKAQAFYREKKEVKKFPVSGRVMVDAVSFRERNPNYFFPQVDERSLQDGLLLEDDFKNDREVTKQRTSYTAEDMLLCSATVYGFCFRTKRWAELSVDDIEEITWDSSAFDSLVLPNARKEMIQSLVERHTNGSNGSNSSSDKNGKAFDDIIQGKGQGLVILLHGPPGVGKTLTAEGIAEMKELPLYNLCAGDLGANAEHLEQNLVEITSLAYKWGAIILIDEADVYLAERSLQDIQRNGLVSVFLRHLEYFQGIMFLTTNRLTIFDDAFQSRIHFAMKFGDLTTRAKKTIWETFLRKVPTEAKISEEEIGDLSRKDINGRQIKNIVRTGWDLASWKMEPLSVRHLKTALEASETFEVDFKGAGSADQMRAYT